MNRNFEVVVIGAGAAGLMCAIEAGKRNKKVLIIEHTSKIAEKIRISGGGRCNFTNVYSNTENFLSNNNHFCKSVFSKYTQNDFIGLVKKHKIKFHEKKLGQLFCNNTAKDIIEMLITECEIQKVEISLNTKIKSVIREENLYILDTEKKGKFICSSLVIATGGLSIPKIGASDFGYKIANQFNLNVTNLYPALVPLTFKDDILEFCKSLTGVSIEASVKINKTIFNSDRKISDDNVKISFLIFISFFLSLFILSSLLVVDNIGFEKSFKLSILTLTNTVNSEMFAMQNINFSNLLTSSKISLILFMVIGKIELISVFLIFKKILFRN